MGENIIRELLDFTNEIRGFSPPLSFYHSVLFYTVTSGLGNRARRREKIEQIGNCRQDRARRSLTERAYTCD